MKPRKRKKKIGPLAHFFCKSPKELLQRRDDAEGFYFGEVSILGVRYAIAKPPNREGHTCIMGGTGVGKSSCIVKPTIAKWGKAFIAVDINGELYEEWLKNKDPNKRPAKVLDLTASMGSATGHVSYNPLADMSQSDESFMAQSCRELVQCILPLSPNDKDPFWTVAGQDILTGLILHYVSEGMTFLEAIECIQGLPLPMAIQSALKGKSEYAKLLLGQFDTSGLSDGADDSDDRHKCQGQQKSPTDIWSNQ